MRTIISFVIASAFFLSCFAQDLWNVPVRVEFYLGEISEKSCQFTMNGKVFKIDYEKCCIPCQTVLDAAWMKESINYLFASNGYPWLKAVAIEHSTNIEADQAIYREGVVWFGTNTDYWPCAASFTWASPWNPLFVRDWGKDGASLCEMLRLISLRPGFVTDIGIGTSPNDPTEIMTLDLMFDDYFESTPYEHNDIKEGAYNLSNYKKKWLSEIKSKAILADADWYRINVANGHQRVIVLAEFKHSEGDIDIRLYNQNGALVAGAGSTTDNEMIDFEVPNGGVYYIKVYQWPEASEDALLPYTGSVYNLWWDATNDDAYEENDNRTAAFDLTPFKGKWLSNIKGKGVKSDEDWYRITIPTAQPVLVRCRFDYSQGNIDLALYNSNGVLLAESKRKNDNEYLNFHVSTPGDYFVQLFNENAGNRYDMVWDSDDGYEENDRLTVAYRLPSPSSLPYLLWLPLIDGPGIQNDDDWYAIYSPATARFYAACYFSHAAGNIDIALYNQSGQLVAQSRGVQDNEILEFDISAGNYYLRVFYGNRGNKYDLFLGILQNTGQLDLINAFMEQRNSQ